MPSSPTSLDDLRARIDEIDDRLHDLLIERTEIVDSIARAKRDNGLPPLRPGREASIIRRLLTRHRGSFPRGALVRMWREMLGAQVSLQGRFAVAVYAPGAGTGYWDLARDHFGSHVPLTGFRSAVQVIRAVAEGEATVGVLPVPQEGDIDPWWRSLASDDEATPRIIARLPFGARGNARPKAGDAFAIGLAQPEKTGNDRSLLLLETTGEASRTRIVSALGTSGLPCDSYASFERAPGLVLGLVDVASYVDPDDARLAKAQEQLGSALERIIRVGGYAAPLTSRELGA